MNHFSQRLKLLTLSGLGFLMLGSFSFATAEDHRYPNISLVHSSPAVFSTQNRTSLLAQIHSTKSIKTVRCYFKSSLDQQWLFIPAQLEGVLHYRCVLPRFDSQVASVASHWVVVNQDEQVTRTAVRHLNRSTQTADLFQPLPAPSSSLILFDELWGGYQPRINEHNSTVQAVTGSTQRYGLIAGLYTTNQIPHWQAAKPGFFGGFELTKQGVFAIKGFAPNLANNQASTASAQLMAELTLEPIVANVLLSLGSNNWSGYFQTTGYNNRVNLSANIRQAGNSIDIITSKSGLAHRLIGTINSSGHILAYDQSDGEDWTTHLGPAQFNSVNLYDYIRAPSASDPRPPLNSLILARVVVPSSPSNLQAVYGDAITQVRVHWLKSNGASYYLLYRCASSASNLCTLAHNTTQTTVVDHPTRRATWYYRVKACNNLGCSALSAPYPLRLQDSSFAAPVIVPFLVPLLLD